MDGRLSGEIGQSSSAEKSKSSRVESPSRSRDFIRDQANSSRRESPNPNRPDAWNHEQIEGESKSPHTQAQVNGEKGLERILGVKSPPCSHDFIRWGWANSSRRESPNPNRPYARNHERIEGESKSPRTQAQAIERRESPNPNRAYARNHERIERESKLPHTQAIERGKSIMQKCQQEAKRYQSKDRDTFEDFKHTFKSAIIIRSKNHILQVTSESTNEVHYINQIDVDNGKIIGIYNGYGYNRGEKRKIEFSEIVFNQLRLAMEHLKKDISQFDLKGWYGQHIWNLDTINTVKLFFPEEKENGSVKEGKKIFEAGSDGFIALAGTPTGKSKFYLLAQHQNAFKGKIVKSITVIRKFGGQIDIEYEFG